MKDAMFPFVSFVIPARNEEENIEKCMLAILNLDYAKDRYEVIVADGGSEDRTAEVARARGAIVIKNAKIIQSAARNLGAMNAKGELIAFIDADIILEREWLKKAIIHFRDPDVAAVGNFPGIAEESNWLEKAWFFYVQNRHSSNSAISVEWLASANVIFRKAIFNKIGGFDETIRYTEDVDISFRARRSGYKIILDPGLESTHLQYEVSLRGFIKRQLAGGRTILHLIKNYGIRRNWRISFFIAYYLFWTVIFITGLLLLNLYISAAAVLFMILLASVISIERCWNAKSFKYFLPLTFLIFLSGIMRAIALVLPGKK
jgi:cellulose synthase/poly-beta-1,6-N-acetylglucosamine synthase-like glycosyltransferase